MEDYEKLKSIILATCTDMPEPMRFCKRCGDRAYYNESREVYYCLGCPHEDPKEPEGIITFSHIFHTIGKTKPSLLIKDLSILKGLDWNSDNNNLDHQSDETKQFLIDLLL